MKSQFDHGLQVTEDVKCRGLEKTRVCGAAEGDKMLRQRVGILQLKSLGTEQGLVKARSREYS